MKTNSIAFQREKARYKRKFGQRLRRIAHKPTLGGNVFLSRVYDAHDKGGMRNLASRADGPYILK